MRVLLPQLSLLHYAGKDERITSGRPGCGQLSLSTSIYAPERSIRS